VVVGQGGSDVAPHEVVLGVAVHHEPGDPIPRWTFDGAPSDVTRRYSTPGSNVSHFSPHSRAIHDDLGRYWPTVDQCCRCGGYLPVGRRVAGFAEAALQLRSTGNCALCASCAGAAALSAWKSATAITSRSRSWSHVCRSLLCREVVTRRGSSTRLGRHVATWPIRRRAAPRGASGAAWQLGVSFRRGAQDALVTKSSADQRRPRT